MADLSPTPEFKNDHDVLVALYVEQRQMKADIKELKDNTNGRVHDLEQEKADNKDLLTLQEVVTAHTQTISLLQKIVWTGLGFLAAIQIYLQFFRT